MHRKTTATLLLATATIGLLTACSDRHSDAQSVRPRGPGPVTIAVPGNARTIGAAVAAARPGDLVLVSPGEYKETVAIKTRNVTVRGTDRNRVIVDGQFIRPNGVVVTAPGVAVQNMTVRNNMLNGVLVTGMVNKDGGIAKGSDGYSQLDPAKFPPLKHFQVDHITSYNNGLYGIYAFDTQHGLLANNYVSGMADSGIYVGQCKPCDIVVRDNIAERNAVGYEGTNASGSMFVVGNRFVGNRVGATVDSDHQEAFLPQAGATIAGNLIAANDQRLTPQQAEGGFGIGFGIAGGTQNLVFRNRIEMNAAVGLVLASSDDLPPRLNRIVSNVFSRNATDVSYAASAAAPGDRNCLQDNTVATTSPRGLPSSMRCPGSADKLPGVPFTHVAAPPGIAFTDVKAPPVEPNLPGAATAPAVRVVDPPSVDVDKIAVPSKTLLADGSDIRW